MSLTIIGIIVAAIGQVGQIQSVIVSVLGFLFTANGISVPEGCTESVVGGVIALVGLAIAWYGRWRRGDIKIWGGRKA